MKYIERAQFALLVLAVLIVVLSSAAGTAALLLIPLAIAQLLIMAAACLTLISRIVRKDAGSELQFFVSIAQVAFFAYCLDRALTALLH